MKPFLHTDDQFIGLNDGLLEDIRPMLRHPVIIQTLALMQENPLATYERIIDVLEAIANGDTVFATDASNTLDKLSMRVCNQACTELEASIEKGSFVHSIDVARKFYFSLRKIFNHSDGEVKLVAQGVLFDLLMEQSLPMSEIDSNPWIDGYTGEKDEMDYGEVTEAGADALVDEVIRQGIAKRAERIHQLKINPLVQSVMHATKELKEHTEAARLARPGLMPEEIYIDGTLVRVMEFDQMEFLKANKIDVGSGEEEPLEWTDINWSPETLKKSAELDEEGRNLYYEGLGVLYSFHQARQKTFKDMSRLFSSARRANEVAHSYVTDELDGEVVTNNDYVKRHSSMKLRLFDRWTKGLDPEYDKYKNYLLRSKKDQLETERSSPNKAGIWANIFTYIFHRSSEFLNLVSWIERVARINGLAALAIFMKAQGDYGLQETDIKTCFLINELMFDLDDAVSSYGEDVTEQTASGGLRKHYDERESDYQEYNVETLKLISEAFPLQNDNVLNTRAYNMGYIQTVLDGGTMQQATAFAWWSWRHEMSPIACQAFDWRIAQGGTLKQAWADFYRICPLKRTERITNVSSIGIKLERRGWIDWKIAILKLEHNELNLDNGEKLLTVLSPSMFNSEFSSILASKLAM